MIYDFGAPLGYRSIGDFSYLGCMAGGDWEAPVYFIIYFDGRKLRAYIPKGGNCWNYTTKKAIGNSEEHDSKFLCKHFKVEDCTDIQDDLIEQMYDTQAYIEDIKKRMSL